MPDIYAEKPEVTEPFLEILDPTPKDMDESAGFNPYDTATLYLKRE